MNTVLRAIRVPVTCLVILLLTACGGGSGGNAPPADQTPAPAAYTIGGTVSGLTGSVVLQNNGGNNLSVSTAGAFTFSTALVSGAAYDITVLTQPTGQTCAVTSGSGTVSSANVTSAAVTCTTNMYTLGGTVSGLGAGKSVVLRASSDAVADNHTATINGAFTFPVTFVGDAEYTVQVFTQPVGQTCDVANGEGGFANANVTNVAVTCIDSSPSLRNWTSASSIVVDADVLDANGIVTPQVGVDAAGNALAVWSADNVGMGGTSVYWSRRPMGGNWSTPAKIPDWVPPPPDPAFAEVRRNPVLAVAANGNAVAAWREGPTSIGFDVMASFFTPASGWTQPEYVWIKDPDQASGAENLRISIDSGERVLLIWEAAGFIQYNRHTPGGGWVNTSDGVGSLVSGLTGGDVGDARDPELAMNAAGQAVAVWRHRDTLETPGAYELRASRYDMDANAWTTPQAVDPVPSTETYGVLGLKSVVIDSVGVATAVWAQFDGTRMRIMASRLTDNTWATAAAIETGNDIPQGYTADPRAVIDGSGNIVAVWQQGDVENGHYVANRYVPGTGWGTQQNIGNYVGSSSPIFSTEVSLAGNASGHVVVVWTLPSGVGAENVPLPTDLNANEYNPENGNWGSQVVIDKEVKFAGEIEDDAATPSVAVDPAGNAVAVWDENGEQDIDGIRTARYE